MDDIVLGVLHYPVILIIITDVTCKLAIIFPEAHVSYSTPYITHAYKS